MILEVSFWSFQPRKEISQCEGESYYTCIVLLGWQPCILCCSRPTQSILTCYPLLLLITLLFFILVLCKWWLVVTPELPSLSRLCDRSTRPDTRNRVSSWWIQTLGYNRSSQEIPHQFPSGACLHLMSSLIHKYQVEKIICIFGY